MRSPPRTRCVRRQEKCLVKHLDNDQPGVVSLERPPTDLQRAADGYRRGVELLVAHRGTLIQRLNAAAVDHLVDACPWNRPRMDPFLPAPYQPERDLPDALRERMRLVAVELTDVSQTPSPGTWIYLSDERADVMAAEVLKLEKDLRDAWSTKRRVTTNLWPPAVDLEELSREPTAEELLVSRVWSEEHLIILGRIVELSSEIEVTCRRLLGRALAIPESGLGSRQYTDAVFLGSRVKDLAARLKALSETEGVPAWLVDAASWAKRASNAEQRRDALLHRPAVLVMGGESPRPGLSRARRSQEVEVLTTQASDLLRELDGLRRASFGLKTVTFTWADAEAAVAPPA